MATHSSILAWTIPWTEEPGSLQFMDHTESDMTKETSQAPTHRYCLPRSFSSSYTDSFPGGSDRKNPPAMQETRAWFLGWEDPLEKEWPPSPVFLPGESHGQRIMVDYSPRGGKASGMIEWLIHTHTHTHTQCFFLGTSLLAVLSVCNVLNIICLTGLS